MERRGYFATAFNWLDFAIVISSAVDSLLNFSQGQNSGALSSLRTLRILRMVRLVRSWDGMQGVLRTLVYALASLGPLCILIGLFMYIFALLGMQLFGGNFRCGLSRRAGMGAGERVRFSSLAGWVGVGGFERVPVAD